MKNLNYKLIVSDYDGTLVSANGTISEKNIKAIKNYVNAGGIFAISTGRLPSAILPVAQKLDLKGLLCCGQGTVIIDIESGKVIFDAKLSLETTLSACRKMEEMKLNILAFDLWEYYSSEDNVLLKAYEEVSGTDAVLVKGKKLSKFISEKNMSVYKLIALVEAKDNADVLAKLKEADIPDCEITKSLDFLVEVVNNNYSKGTSVAFLAKHYGIAPDKTVAIGDNCNDITMIEAAGFGVAVKNADAALKEKADFVCGFTNEESAIADIIEKFGFEK